MIQDKIQDKRKALGRGLDALLPSTRPAAAAAPAPVPAEGASREIEIALIDRNPYQTRRKIDEHAIHELASSIRASGVLQPVLVRPIEGGRFQLMAGERRWLASQRAEKTTIPAIVKQVSNQQAMEITIIENLQREDLNPMEQARAYERLSREFNLTQAQIAERTGKDRASVANFLRLMKLPAKVQEGIEKGELSFGHAKVLLMLQLEPQETFEKVVRKIVEQGLSVRQTEDLIYSMMTRGEARGMKKKSRMVDPNVRELELAVQRALGCKVEINDRGGSGKIILEYKGVEHFDGIMAALGVK